jgi:YVTN family beta-propeller protein
MNHRNGALSAALLLAFGLAAVGCSRQDSEPQAQQAAAPAAPTAPQAVAYVTNQDNGVTVIDLAALAVKGTLDVGGSGPRGIGITDDGKVLVTANRDQGNISLVDTASGKVIAQVPIGKNPEFVRVHGGKAYVSYEPASKGGPPPKPGEEAKAEKDDDDEAREPARVAIVDLAQHKVVQEITSGPETEGIEFSTDGKKLIVTNEADNTITVHDLADGKLLKTIPTHEYGDRPRGIKAAPDGKGYVATLEYGDKILVLDADFNPVRTVDTGKGPYGIAFGPDGKHIFVAAFKDKLFQVFDAATYEKVKDIPAGERCWHFSFTPDGKQILLACGRSHELLVIDAEKLEVTKHIGELALPWGVVTYPRASGSLDLQEH